ncbi:TPA: hypothetical protein HA363_03385 [Candidatus Woesearchaeota archaeon]|nr:hypothetical protein [Candidatus Woesearchaeota archaeon]
MNKKAVEMSIQTVIVIVLVLLVLFFLVYFLIYGGSIFNSGLTCEDKKGTCVGSVAECDQNGGTIGPWKCDDKTQPKCCIPLK